MAYLSSIPHFGYLPIYFPDVIVEQAHCNTFEEREKLQRAIDSDVEVNCLLQEKKVFPMLLLAAF